MGITTMKPSYLFVVLLIALCSVGCGNANKDEAEVTLSLCGISIQGNSQDDVIRKLIEQTDEFDYYDEERTGIWRLMFCGIPFGLNIDLEQNEDSTTIRKIVLMTTHQRKAEFMALKDAISKRIGNPDVEDYEGGTDEFEGVFIGRCAWYKDECNVILRHLHGEEGGFVVFFESLNPRWYMQPCYD